MINTRNLIQGARVRITYTGAGFSGSYTAPKAGDGGEFVVECNGKNRISWRNPVTGGGTSDAHVLLDTYQRRGLSIELLA